MVIMRTVITQAGVRVLTCHKDEAGCPRAAASRSGPAALAHQKVKSNRPSAGKERIDKLDSIWFDQSARAA